MNKGEKWTAIVFIVCVILWCTRSVVWGKWMPDEFLGLTMTSPWFYSALYNGSYMVLDLLLCLVVGALLWKPLGKYFRGEDLKQA